MPKLRHLIISHPIPELLYTPKLRSDPRHLLDPSNIGIVNKSNLQTLNGVVNFIFTEDVIKIIKNLKKLTVVFDEYVDNFDDFNLNNLSRLQNLEELEVSLDLRNHFFGSQSPNPFPPWDYAFPTNLNKLTLRGVPFPWENMTIIGSLPYLQVLKIVENKIRNWPSEWTSTDGQFLRLKYFCSSLDDLVTWEVEKDHLPSLESLILRNVAWIDEIPRRLGEIDSLQLIELVSSAKRIQQQQHENNNLL